MRDSMASSVDQQYPDEEDHESRFRVDRKKLEIMLQKKDDGSSLETGEEFFQRIMNETNTHITWPSKLKIGAKSKKDPHIKVTGKVEDVEKAKETIMKVLDTKSNRVTLKMDVSYTEHSHVIGKGGNIIKKVMEDTGCHIHFPDSNRGSQTEKSNQVSIAGQPMGVEAARLKIRALLPLVLMFDLPLSGGGLQGAPDMNSPAIQQLVQTYGISVTLKQQRQTRAPSTCTFTNSVVVRGCINNCVAIKEGTSRLIQHLAGSLASTVVVSMQLEIAPQHHLFMIGRGGVNLKQIMQYTGATIHFPDPNAQLRKSTVLISGTIDSIITARHLLIGCLPIVLMFDMKESAEVDQKVVTQLMEKLDVFISIKDKPKQPSKSVIVKSVERNAANLYQARQFLLGQSSEETTFPIPSGDSLPISGLGLSTFGLLGTGMIGVSTNPGSSYFGCAVDPVSPSLPSPSPDNHWSSTSPRAPPSPSSSGFISVQPTTSTTASYSNSSGASPAISALPQTPAAASCQGTADLNTLFLAPSNGYSPPRTISSSPNHADKGGQAGSRSGRSSTNSSSSSPRVSPEPPSGLSSSFSGGNTSFLASDFGSGFLDGSNGLVDLLLKPRKNSNGGPPPGLTKPSPPPSLSNSANSLPLRRHSESSDGESPRVDDNVVAAAVAAGLINGISFSANSLFASEYEQKRVLASKAIKKKPLGSQVRLPTDAWSGLGFSKSMPEAVIKEARSSNSSLAYRPLDTTYESSEDFVVETGGNSCWNSAEKDRKPPASAAPGEYPANRKKKDTNLLSYSSYIDSISLPQQSRGLWSQNNADLPELFSQLGLGKYAEVFQQQEIDLTTFMTLTDQDLKELGISTFGARRRMLIAISDLNKNKPESMLRNSMLATEDNRIKQTGW